MILMINKRKCILISQGQYPGILIDFLFCKGVLRYALTESYFIYKTRLNLLYNQNRDYMEHFDQGNRLGHRPAAN